MKKFILPLIAMMASFAMTAFRTVSGNASRPLSGVYWVFNGNPNSSSEIADPLKYSLAPGNQPTCSATTDLCNIFADPQTGDPNHPNLATEVQSMRTFKR